MRALLLPVARDCPNAGDNFDNGGNVDANKSCYNCGEMGHISRNCTNDKVEGADEGKGRRRRRNRTRSRRCFNCGEEGHLSADCPEPPGNTKCYICKKEGHISRDCPEK